MPCPARRHSTTRKCSENVSNPCTSRPRLTQNLWADITMFWAHPFLLTIKGQITLNRPSIKKCRQPFKITLTRSTLRVRRGITTRKGSGSLSRGPAKLSGIITKTSARRNLLTSRSSRKIHLVCNKSPVDKI